MLNQVSRALAQLFRPIATTKSDADRDPSGNSFEKFTPPKKSPDKEDGQSNDSSNGKSDSQKAPFQIKATETKTGDESANGGEGHLGQVLPFSKQTPEEVVEGRKREIRNSQAWLSLVNLFQDSKSASAGSTKEGPDAYDQGAGSKKGVIVDKKAG